MNRISKFRVFGFLLAFLTLALPPVSAGVMTQDFQLTGSLENPAFVAIDQFDPVVGTLTEVRLSYDLQAVSQFAVSDSDLFGPWVAYFDLAASVEFGSFLSGPLLGRGVAVLTGVQSLPSGLIRTGIGYGYVRGQGSAVLSDPGTLADFRASGVAGGTWNLPSSATPFQTSQLSILNGTSFLSGQLSVTYVFDDPVSPQEPFPNAAVPEPASLAILGIGAIVMVRSRRRRVCPQTRTNRSNAACVRLGHADLR